MEIIVTHLTKWLQTHRAFAVYVDGLLTNRNLCYMRYSVFIFSLLLSCSVLHILESGLYNRWKKNAEPEGWYNYFDKTRMLFSWKPTVHKSKKYIYLKWKFEVNVVFISNGLDLQQASVEYKHAVEFCEIY